MAGSDRSLPVVPLRVIPGTATTCFLLTAMTVLLAVFAGHPRVDLVLRPLYFALLFSFFHAIGRAQRELRDLPFRLIEFGFLVLTLGFTAAAIARGTGIDGESLLDAIVLAALERGAVFLIGLSLITYGGHPVDPTSTREPPDPTRALRPHAG